LSVIGAVILGVLRVRRDEDRTEKSQL
jgi:hypothetical protein